MGLWDSIKNAAIKAKCGVGFHGGIFTTPEGKPKCYLEKTCPDCKELIKIKNHQYEHEWKEAPFYNDSQKQCTRIRNCIHCGEVEKKEIHEEYRRIGVNAKCQVVKECVRCGHEKTDGYEHQYRRLGVNAKCQLVEVCERCRHEKTNGYEHRFIRDGIEDGKIVMKCISCGTTERRKYV